MTGKDRKIHNRLKLRVFKTIHKEKPKYAVLDKVTIKVEILSYL